MSRSLLVVFRSAPYGDSRGRAGLEIALAFAAFEQPITVLFMGEGVLQLLPEQDTTELGARNLGKTLASLPLYGVETLHVDADSLDSYGIAVDSLPEGCTVIGSEALAALMRQHDHLVGM
jgi:tRNA 2-thiouridine synthesizing protein C